ncbi:MAG: hypothetical protein A2360_01535 [Candidatus Staskawiczbacteria bacterium RIFOXYB1_FULL_32_11]|nr:MAG: hypothetical protein UR22_C0020G0019 [Parcubacteria group bacterium GW2011_GWC2_32_10]OGZ80950.1 MAG: hypothetical protein A2360_01535 [Candidatus Staskawiczbacteria bacterium RIFOXYB1_FULL_32_11]
MLTKSYSKNYWNSKLYMVIDIELTLNRFGFGKIAENKFQLFCFRFSKWNIVGKHSISFEINWRTKDK